MDTSAKKKSSTKEAAAPAAETAPQDAKRRPLKTFTLGDVHASVWARDHAINGRLTRFYSASFERSYRDSAGKTGYSRSFNPDDLGTLMALCQEAGQYIDGLKDLVPVTEQD